MLKKHRGIANRQARSSNNILNKDPKLEHAESVPMLLSKNATLEKIKRNISLSMRIASPFKKGVPAVFDTFTSSGSGVDDTATTAPLKSSSEAAAEPMTPTRTTYCYNYLTILFMFIPL